MTKQEFIDEVKKDHLSRWKDNVDMYIREMGQAAYDDSIKRYVDLEKQPVEVSPRVMFEMLKEVALNGK